MQGEAQGMMRPDLCSVRLPLRFMRGNYGRLALTVLALATGVASVCSNSLTSQAVIDAFADALDTAAGTAALQVQRGDGGAFPKEVAIKVGRAAGIAAVVPVLTATAFSADGSGELIAVHAYDLVDDIAAHMYGVDATHHGTVYGAQALVPGSVIVTEPFARRHHLGIANRVPLDTPTGRQTFTVAGIVPASGLARLYGGNLIVMDLYAAQVAFAHPGEINRVDLALKPGEDPDQVAARIRGALPPGMQVESPTFQKVLMERTTGAVHQLLRVFILGGLLAAVLIAFSSLSTLFERRMWEIGILRGLGVRQRTIWWQLTLEGLLLGALGVVIGIPLGVAYGYVLLPQITAATAIIANNIAPVPHLQLHLSTLLVAAFLGVATGGAAAALPAWRAAHVQIVDTIRSRGIEQVGIEGRSGWLFRGLVVAAAVAAIGMEVISQSGGWGLAGGILLIAATAVVARPVVDFAGSAALRRWLALLGASAQLGVAQIARRPRRTALAVAMLGVGTGSALWLWMLARSIEGSVTDMLTQTCRADLVVSSSHVASAFIESPIDETLLTRLRDVVGVRAVTGIRNVEVQYGGVTIAVEADDRSYLRKPTFGRFPLIGRRLPNAWKLVAGGEAVIASANFVQNLHSGVGDSVTLSTPSGPLRLRIAGVTNQFLSPNGTLIMSREVYTRFWNDRQITRAYVLLRDGVATATVRAAIAAGLGRVYSLRILSAPELIEYFVSRVRAAFAGMYVLAIAMLVVVLVGVGETIAAEVVSRTRELGMIRMLGARRRRVRRMVLAETLVLSALGIVVAVATGLAQGVLWVEATFPHLFGFVVALHIPYGESAIIVLSTLAACLLAAALPAQRAARLQPVAALRYE
jgi:putative ABC transport system permease protein